MWMSKQMVEGRQKNGLAAEQGEITGVANKALVALGTREYRGIPAMVPYGFLSVPPETTRVILLPVGEEAVIAGTCADTMSLNPGEVCLRSAGGAEIVLKNSGEVWINGQVFAPKEE